MSDDLPFSPDSTPPWLRPEIPEHLRPLAAPPRPDRAPTLPDQRDTDTAAAAVPPPPATAPPTAPAPWAVPAAPPPGQPAPDPVTRRLRRTVTDLPSWDPLPPGEQLVRRPRRDL
ncbi:hypothetical protein F9278_04400 [Streptomyces phaeolivaceus]|uniref:Uncharacterized protein n=1 Tax=Streptomyces phaeolivaceus TaxID=2653200 RepID=A0A5P8JXG3_9ACTN|nr:hypothetical protein [Streptomyces phaeolivaceus]QFQ95551.1 hypothetical protein F9278_04400 [Streptomyces phaeolivaceus]